MKNLLHNFRKIPVKDYNITDIKNKIENKRQNQKFALTSKRIYDFNPNYLSDKNIFEWNFEEDKHNKTYFEKSDNKISDNLKLSENEKNNPEFNKYQKRLFKTDKHHQQ